MADSIKVADSNANGALENCVLESDFMPIACCYEEESPSASDKKSATSPFASIFNNEPVTQEKREQSIGLNVDDKKFIREVESRRILWDKRTKEWNDGTRRDATFREIAKMFNISVTDCKTNWKRLRDRYVRLRWKTLPNGSGMDEGNSITWSLYPLLQFLEPVIRNRKAIGSSMAVNSDPYEMQSTNDNTVDINETQIETEELAHEKDAYPEGQTKEVHLNSFNYSDQESLHSPASTSTADEKIAAYNRPATEELKETPGRKRRRTKELDEFETSMLNIMKSRVEIAKSKEHMSSAELFFNSLVYPFLEIRREYHLDAQIELLDVIRRYKNLGSS